MATSSQVDLSTLVKQLQEQVNVITTYLEAERLSEPTFVPSSETMKSGISSLPPAVENARKRAYSLSWGLHTLLATPGNHLLMINFQVFDMVALRILMEKDICSIIPILSSGIPAAEISGKAGIPENILIRILRQLTGIGIFREPSPRVFAHTTTSAFLQENTSIWQDVLLHFSDESFKAAAYLPESLDLYADQFDKVQKPDLRTAFNLGFNTDAHFFDWLYFPENVNHYGRRFGRAMMGVSHARRDSFLDCYDWTKLDEGDKIVDVGGGVGHIGVLVKKRVKPGVQVIVQDLPTVVEQGRAIPEHREILEFQAHDFFSEQPVVGAKLYYLRMIAHDWPDKACQTILGHVANAMNSESKVLIIDSVWPEGEYWASGKDDKSIVEAYSSERRFNNFRDMQMMNILGITCFWGRLILGSKERSEEEWYEILKTVGLKIIAIYAGGSTGAVIEAIKA